MIVSLLQLIVGCLFATTTHANFLQATRVLVNGQPEGSFVPPLEGDKWHISWQATTSFKFNPLYQTSFEVRVLNNHNNVLIYETGLVYGSSNVIEFTASIQPLASFYVAIMICDNYNPSCSAWTYHNFSVPIIIWLPAQWITVPSHVDGTDVTANIFIKSFSLPSASPIVQATLSVAGLGLCEVEINNMLVSDWVLEPQWTSYQKRVIFNSVDVRKYLQMNNVVRVIVGNGMYNVPKSDRYAKWIGSSGPRKLIFRLDARFQDGSVLTVISDPTWQVDPSSPIVFNTIYGGETFDARLDTNPPSPPSEWPYAILSQSSATLYPRTAPAVRVMETLSPVKPPTQPKPGVYLYDFGRNFAGRIRVLFSVTPNTPPGTVITFIPGELLKNGMVSQDSSGKNMYWSFITTSVNTTSRVEWVPRFSYYGFRWVQVQIQNPADDHLQDAPVIISLSGEIVRSSVPISGDFSSDNDLYNNIHTIIVRAMQSNIMSILTDCPHREKLGWLEQDYLMGPSLAYNLDLSNFFPKIIWDIVDSQLSSGLVPDISPEYTDFVGNYRDSPEWGSTSILVPVLQYVKYGDIGPIKVVFEETSVAKNYIDYLLSKRGSDGIVRYGLGDWADIGQLLQGAQLTPIGVTATLTLYMDLIAAASASKVLNRTPDAQNYTNLAQQVAKDFNAAFFHDNTYASNSQTSNSMPLSLGIVPSNAAQNILYSIIADVLKYNGHTTCGEVGFPLEICALVQNGIHNLVESMLQRNDSWGYAYILATGATTLPEQWNAQSSASQNHFMLGHIDAWFYGILAGIHVGGSRLSFCNWWSFDEAYDAVLNIEPLVYELSWVSFVSAWHYTEKTGNVSIQWRLTEAELFMTVDVPSASHNRTFLCIPRESPSAIIGKFHHHKGSLFINSEENCDRYLLSGGHYEFVIERKTGN